MATIESLAISDSAKEKLASLGVDNSSQLAGLLEVSSEPISSFLGITRQDLVSALPPEDVSFSAASDRPSFSFGVRLDAIPRELLAFSVSTARSRDLPESVNLIGEMSEIRDQEQRGTCVAFATIAIFEHLHGLQEDFSEQFQYWNCKRQDGIENEAGTWIGVSVPALNESGCCREATWPYVASDVPGNEGQGPATNEAIDEASGFSGREHVQLSPTSVKDIKAALADGHPVAFSVPLFQSIYSPDTTRSGVINNPVPREREVGGHAMVLVGYRDDKSAGLGGGRFFVRNSWGSQNWAYDSVIDGNSTPGYGTIPYSYIARYGSEAYHLQ